MVEQKEFLPLGSLVTLEGATQKLLIIARAVILKEELYKDYGAVLYPEGLLGNQVAYFDQSEIYQVLFTGFQDEEEALMVAQLKKAYQNYVQPVQVDSTEMPEEEDPYKALRDMEENDESSTRN